MGTWGRTGNRLYGALGAAAAVFALTAPTAHAAVTFEPKEDFPASDAFSLTTGDFNADGVADVGTSTFAGTNISVLLGNGDGTLQAPRNTTGPSQQSSIAAGDFNGDGRDDLAVVDISSEDVTIFLSQGDGTFGAGTPLNVGASPQDVHLARLDADSDLDLAVATQTGETVDIFLNNGTGGFSAAPPISHAALTGAPDGAVAADFDADGDNDIAIGTTGGGEVAFARNQGPGTFDAPVGLGTTGQKLTAGDINRDGRLDIAAARTTGGDVGIILRNAGNTGFDAATTFDPIPPPAPGNAISQIALDDLDGDGRLDLAIPHITGSQAGTVSVAIGRGNGQFDLNGHEIVGAQPREVVAADFNRDGNPDLATANDGPNNVSVLLAVPPAVTVIPAALAFGDQQQGTASPEQSFMVRNDGVPHLRIGTVALGGADAGDFGIVRDTCSGANLAPGASCEVGASFAPDATGGRNAQVTIASNGGGAPHAVPLAGAGVSSPPLPGACSNTRRGTAARDTLIGTSAGDDISGLAGDDVLKGLAGDDCLTGGTGDDRGNGGPGDDRLNGGGGSDRMGGSAGSDVVNGAGGDDRLKGGPGRNRIKGGGGDDRINADNGAVDRVKCGSGRDRVKADPSDDLKRCELV